MNPWLLLIPALVAFSAGMLSSYNEHLKSTGWSTPLYIAGNVIGTITWIVAIYLFPNKRELFTFGVVWDVCRNFVCVVLVPILFLQLRNLKTTEICGIVLLFAGAVLIAIGRER